MAIRARSIGELLDGAFRLYRQDLGLYMFTAIVAFAPMSLFTVLLTGTVGDPAAAGAVTLLLISLIAGILTAVAWTALMHQMNERLDGREPALGPSARQALRLGLRVVWASILTSIVLGGTIFLGTLAVFIVIAMAPSSLDILRGVVVAIVVGAIVFVFALRVIPGIALFLPGIVVENLTGYQSIRRSFALAKGGQVRILSVLVFSWILIFVPVVAASFVTGATATLFNPEAASSGVVGMGQFVVQQVLVLISAGFTTPFFVASTLLLYFDQRVRLEAYDLQAEADALAD